MTTNTATAAVIDATPTWSELLPGMLAVLDGGKREGRAIVRQELERMARAADGYNEMVREQMRKDQDA